MNVIPLNFRSFGLSFLALLLVVGLNAQTPAKKQEKSILLLNATAHIGNGEVIPQSAIGFSNGKIDMVISALDINMDSSHYDTILHIDGKHVYPGFIAPNSRLGLVEINAIRASRDFRDVGNFKPHVRSLIAYNTESKIIPTVRTNGVLIAEVAPTGGTIAGTSSIFQLDGWNWEDAALKIDNGIHMNWPSAWNSLGEDKKNDGKRKERYKNALIEIEQFFKAAFAYTQPNYRLEKNLRFEAMRAVFSKEKKIFLHANRVQEITDAIYFFDQFDVDLVIVGGNDAWMISDLLKDRKIPVLLRRVHSLPMNQDDAIDLPYQLPARLLNSGLLVGLENSGDMEAMGTRNLPFYAGTAAAYGIEKEDALQLITLNTAKILGIDKEVGSLEEGKMATLFVSDGDALEMMTNKVSMAFINGKKLDLTNHQIQLWEKYEAKYRE